MGLYANTKEQSVTDPLNNSKSVSGFTIIEVLIVLAIAGLIILIVLLAVPALQRGNRNSTRKKDVTRIAGAVVNYVSVKNGTLPSTNADATVILTDAGTLGQYNLTAASPIGTAASTKLSIVAAGAGTPAALSTGLTDAVQIVTGGVCSNANDGSATNVGGNSKSIAIQYTLETGTSGISQSICQNS